MPHSQVPDILTTDGGVYLRHILASLQRPALRYQTSIYVLPAGAYGVPQWRYRVIVLAARQGEVLPPMPAPMFRVGSLASFSGRFSAFPDVCLHC